MSFSVLYHTASPFLRYIYRKIIYIYIDLSISTNVLRTKPGYTNNPSKQQPPTKHVLKSHKQPSRTQPSPSPFSPVLQPKQGRKDDRRTCREYDPIRSDLPLLTIFRSLRLSFFSKLMLDESVSGRALYDHMTWCEI